MGSKKFAVGIAMLAVLSLVAAACGDDGGTTPSANALATLSGTIQVDGSSTVQPITAAVAEEFKGAGAKTRVAVGIKGTGGGFERFCNGETDISNASRPIKTDDAKEKPNCTAKGIEYVELKVAIDGLSVLTNPANTFVDCLTVAELKKIWEPGSKVKNWNQVRSGFPNQPLSLFGPGSDSGTFDYFTKEINGEEGASRTDYTGSEDDNTLVQGVAGDKNALGYFGFAYYNQNKDKLRLLGVDSGSGCLKPDDANIKDGTYKPLSRPLFIYVKKTSAARPEVKAFVDYYLDNVSPLLPSVGYVALADADLAASKQAWSTFTA